MGEGSWKEKEEMEEREWAWEQRPTSTWGLGRAEMERNFKGTLLLIKNLHCASREAAHFPQCGRLIADQ